MSPIVTVVASLKLDKILPVELSLSKEMFICLKAGKEMFICLKAGRCNRSAAVPGSTSTLCTSKLLTYKVSTSASWCGVMTLDRFIGGNNIRSSIGWITLLLSGTLIVFTWALTVAAHKNLFFWCLD